MEIAERQIAKRIRDLRKRHQLTLRHVAEKAGLTKSFLSKVERSSVSISIAALSRVAKALEVPLGEFFEDDETRSDAIYVPRAKRGTVTGGNIDLPYRYEMLIPKRGARQMQPVMVSLAGDKAKLELREHPGEQFILMMEGQMDYVCGKQMFTLQAGDCLYLKANVSHGPQPKPRQKASYLVVFTSQ